MKNDYKIVTYNNKNYIVSYTQKNEPFVFDQEDFQNTKDLLKENIDDLNDNELVILRQA